MLGSHKSNVDETIVEQNNLNKTHETRWRLLNIKARGHDLNLGRVPIGLQLDTWPTGQNRWRITKIALKICLVLMIAGDSNFSCT
jgi:hypothetical protein